MRVYPCSDRCTGERQRTKGVRREYETCQEAAGVWRTTEASNPGNAMWYSDGRETHGTSFLGRVYRTESLFLLTRFRLLSRALWPSSVLYPSVPAVFPTIPPQTPFFVRSSVFSLFVLVNRSNCARPTLETASLRLYIRPEVFALLLESANNK